MRPFPIGFLLLSLLGAVSSIPHPDQKNQLHKRFVNLIGKEEGDLRTRPSISNKSERKTKSKPSKSKPSSTTSAEPPISTPSSSNEIPKLLPTYPKGVTNPVDPNSFLMQLATKIAPYWNYTEVLWEPCQRSPDSYEPVPEPCVPSCEDVHSHTRIALWVDCKRIEVCAFATFVLPDEQCPGRVNSYEKRCPANAADFIKNRQNVVRWHGSGNIGRVFDEFVFKAMEDRMHPTPEDCGIAALEEYYAGFQTESNDVSTPAEQGKPESIDTADEIPSPANVIDVRTFHQPPTSHSLQKRVYRYRQRLDIFNFYRTLVITGPLHGGSDIVCPLHTHSKDPLSRFCAFACENETANRITEYFYYAGRSIPLCNYPMSTVDDPDERCPGMASPETDCPQTEEEIIAQIAGKSGDTEDKVWEVIKEQKEKMPKHCLLFGGIAKKKECIVGNQSN